MISKYTIEKRYQNTPLYTIIDEIHEDNIYATSLVGTKVYLKDTLSGMGGGCQVQAKCDSGHKP